MNTEWLDGLKAGDDVICSVPFGGDSIRKVQRRTATQIIVVVGKNIVNEDIISRYRSKTGLSVGGDTWSGSWLLEPTQERRNVIQSKRMNTLISIALGNIAIPETLEQRKELYAAIKALPHQEVTK
jgi:hypothetical protein